MTKRLIQHYPTPTREKTIEGVDKQRIYDQRIMQDNISQAIDDIASKSHLESFLIKDVSLTTGTTLVEHKLGYAWSTWTLADIDSLVTVCRDSTSTADKTKFIPLKASAACTINLVVS